MLSSMGSLIRNKPEQARERILAAFLKAKGNRARAAQELGLSNVRSLYRWIDRLSLWEAIEKQARSNGHAVSAGPPRKTDRIKGAVVEARGNIELAAKRLRISQAEVRKAIGADSMTGNDSA